MDMVLSLMLWLGSFAAGIVSGYYLRSLIDLTPIEGKKLHEYKQGLHVDINYSQWI